MNLSQLKEQVRNILRERSVKAIQKEYSSVVDDIQKHLELYKKSKGTPDEKKHVGHLKILGEKKKKLSAELDKAVSGLYKNAELKVDEAITNPKKSNPNDLATTVIGWYDFATDYIDDGGQRRRAEKKNDDVVNWFDSHPLDIKQKAFKVMLSKQPSIKSKIERIFGSKLKESITEEILKPGTKVKVQHKGKTVSGKIVRYDGKTPGSPFYIVYTGQYDSIEVPAYQVKKESVNEAKTYKKGDKLKIKLPNGKKFDVVFDMYARTKGVALGKFKDSHGEYDIKPFDLKSIVESVNEATEPEIISQLKDIVKNKQYQNVKDPKTGKKMKVDMQTANAVLQIYNGLSNVNKDNMVKMGLPKMIDVSFKIINKYK